MEGSESDNPNNFQQQLINLQTLQEQIERTKKELSQLGKVQLLEDKNLQTIYKQSVQTTRNKLNQVESKQHQDLLHEMQMQELKMKQ